MRTTNLIPLSAAFAAFLAAPSLALTALHLDKPKMVGGIESACTGVGYSSEHNPRWDAYPLKIVLAGKHGQYLADANVSLVQGGKTLVSVHCGGPWVLFKAKPGTYRVVAGIRNTTETALANVTAGRQGRVILRFPKMGGKVSARDLSQHRSEKAPG